MFDFDFTSAPGVLPVTHANGHSAHFGTFLGTSEYTPHSIMVIPDGDPPIPSR